MDIWIWVAVIVLALIVELLTSELVSIWFIPGAVIALLLAILHVHIAVQAVVFVVVSILGILLLRTLVMKHAPKSSTKTNIDAIIGEKCIVTERIDNYAGCGQAKVKGQIWSACSVRDEETFEPGEILQVVAIEGVKLICKKYKD